MSKESMVSSAKASIEAYNSKDWDAVRKEIEPKVSPLDVFGMYDESNMPPVWQGNMPVENVGSHAKRTWVRGERGRGRGTAVPYKTNQPVTENYFQAR